MRKTSIVLGEYYHIFNRGNNKQIIFLNDTDKIRFLILLLLLQSPLELKNIKRLVKSYVQSSALHNITETIDEIIKTRYIEILCFTLMPNHFHLTVHELKDGGISKYMHRLLTAYTKYFNIKYEKSGHHFQGPYKAVRIDDNNQLLYLSTYIHRNSRELKGWRNKEDLYPWSSFQDYISNNRWGNLLSCDLILSQFKSKKEYHKFVNSSTAKLNPILIIE